MSASTGAGTGAGTGAYWRGAAEDEAMQDEHGFLWRAILDTIDVDMTGCRVLDVGCNRGGFLRLLVDEAAIAEGYGYFAAMGVHAGSRLMSAWHRSAAAELGLPRLYDLDDVVEAFEGAGFAASVARLRVRFVPISSRRGGHDHRQDLVEWLDYYERDKVLFRFTRPSG